MAVTRAGARVGTASLDLRVLRITGQNSRIGFVVPKYGHSAVQRNQLKRRLRELIRVGILHALRAPDATARLDVVVRTRPNAYKASVESLRAECQSLKDRLVRLRSTLTQPDDSIRTESRSAP